jgi:two-component sensor histidine kinase
MKPVQQAVWEKGKLELSYLENALEVRFAMLDFQNSKQHQYEYSFQKKGNAPQWVSLGTQNSIQLSQLSQGHYWFAIKGKNSKGQEAVLDATFEIIIHPPWWNSNWSWTVYLLTLMAFIVYGYSFLLKRQQEKQQKISLENSLLEKEIMLKEVHHRVKNNLQIISGLFEKQARQTNDEFAKKLIKEGQDRVFSIALVHQNLYQTDHLSQIDLQPYLQELTQNIISSQKNEQQDIQIKLNIEPTLLNIDTAIPLGLVLNELITNCYKYAFTDRKQGLIDIHFHQKGNDYCLIIKDNGIGMAADFDIKTSKSLGLNLVNGLVRQLNGQLEFKSSEVGTVFTILFGKE